MDVPSFLVPGASGKILFRSTVLSEGNEFTVLFQRTGSGGGGDDTRVAFRNLCAQGTTDNGNITLTNISRSSAKVRSLQERSNLSVDDSWTTEEKEFSLLSPTELNMAVHTALQWAEKEKKKLSIDFSTKIVTGSNDLLKTFKTLKWLKKDTYQWTPPTEAAAPTRCAIGHGQVFRSALHIL